MNPIDKRITDVEASVKYIASYVKDHTDKVEKQLREFEPGSEPLSDGLRDELAELKRKLDLMSTENRLSPMKMKNMDDIERKMEGRIERIEQNLIKSQEEHRNRIESKIKPLSNTSSELNNLRLDIAPKMSFFEGKLKKLQEEIENVGSADIAELHEKIAQMNERVDHALAAKKHVEEIETEISEIKKKLPGHFKALEDLELKRAKAVTEQLHKAEDYEKKLKRMFEGELFSKIKTIEDQMSKFNTSERADTKHLESELKRVQDELKERLSQIDIAERADMSYQADELKKMREEFETAVAERMAKLDVEGHLGFNKAEADLKALKEQLEADLTRKFSQANVTEHRDIKHAEADFRKAEADLKALKEQLESDLTQKYSQLSKSEHKDVRHAESDITKLKQELEESLDTKFSQLNLSEHKDVKHAISEIKKLQDELEGKIDSRFSQLNVAEHHDLKHAQEELKSLGASLQEKFTQSLERLDKMEHRDTKHVQDEIEKLNAALETRVKELEIDISKLSSSEQKDISKAKEDMIARIATLEGEVSKFASIELKDLDKIRDQVHASREEIEKHLETSLTQMKLATSQRVKDVEEEIKKFADIELKNVHKTKEELDTKMKTLEEEMKAYADTEMKHLEKSKEELNAKLKELDGEMKKFEGREADIAKKIKDELKINHAELEKNVKTIEERISKLNMAETQDYHKAVDELKQMKEKLETEFINRVSIDKRLKEIEGEVPKFEHWEKEQLKRLNDMLEEFKKNEFDMHRKELEETRHALDAESSRRMSAEKRIHETENEVNALGSKFDRLEHVEGIETLGARLHDLEKNMKMMSVRLLTQQLNEFAKIMDRRLPNIVSKEEYLREVASINQRLKTIESPDLAPMGARVERLENKLEEIHGLVRAMYNRVPVVVE